jgi:hypothetical protein
MITVFCTVVLSVIQRIALNTEVLPFSKRRTPQTPFPAKVKEHSMITSVISKSAKKAIEPDEQITVKPLVAIVKDLVSKNVEDGHIIFCEDASNIGSHPSRSRKTSVHVLSVRIGDHCYYGLCDIGASTSAIPYELVSGASRPVGNPKRKL